MTRGLAILCPGTHTGGCELDFETRKARLDQQSQQLNSMREEATRERVESCETISAGGRVTIAKRERSAAPPFRVSPTIHFLVRAEPSSSERCSWRVYWHRPESRRSRGSRWLHSNRVLPELVLWWIRNPVSLLRLFPLSRNH